MLFQNLAFILPTMAHKISEANSSFHVKYGYSGKSLISTFQEFSSSVGKTFVLAGRLGAGLSFYEV